MATARVADRGTLTQVARPIFRAPQFLTYEQLKSAFAERKLPAAHGADPAAPPARRRAAGASAADKLSVTDLTVAATVSKVIATIVTYPYQVRRGGVRRGHPSVVISRPASELSPSQY